MPLETGKPAHGEDICKTQEVQKISIQDKQVLERNEKSNE